MGGHPTSPFVFEAASVVDCDDCIIIYDSCFDLSCRTTSLSLTAS